MLLGRRAALAFLCAFGLSLSCADADVGSPPGVQTVSSEHLWKATLAVGKERIWLKNLHRMGISPTRTHGAYYVPHDLLDAWRELDAMLPRRFVSEMARHSTRDTCAVGLDNDGDVAHDAVLGFIAEAWVQADDSVYIQYIRRTFALDPARLNADVEYDADVRSLAAGWTLCSFYYLKKSHGHPDLNALYAAFRDDLRALEPKPDAR